MDRFFSKVEHISVGGCWVWTACRSRSGYGWFRAAGRSHAAHRWIWEQLVGTVPAGLELDHLCRNRACVNPAHLEPVTHAENTRRGLSGENMRTKTQCPKGHPYDSANTRVTNRDGRFYRRTCRTCAKEFNRASYLANPEIHRARSRAYRARAVGSAK